MKVYDYLETKGIIIDISAENKTDLLTRMSQYLASLYDLQDSDFITQQILQRELEVSTGIGYGIAIPHARMDTISRIVMIAARCVEGIEFDAIDELPVHLIFMMLSPSNTTVEHTTILSSLSKIMSHEEVRTNLMEAREPQTFHSRLIEGENKYV